MGAIRNEVIRPDMVGPLRPQPQSGAVIEPQPPPLGLFLWDLQPLTPPDPLDPLLVDQPAGCTQQRRDPAIAVAAILAGQLDDVGRERSLIVGRLRNLALRGPVLAKHPAGPSLGHTQLSLNTIHASTAA